MNYGVDWKETPDLSEMSELIARLRLDFPDELIELGVERRQGINADGEAWSVCRFRVRVGEVEGYGHDLLEAFRKLKTEISTKIVIKKHAKRLIALFREIPHENFLRSNVLHEVSSVVNSREWINGKTDSEDP